VRDAVRPARRRVLFIALLYPPIANSGTRRSLCFANWLPQFGWDPVVLTLDGAEPSRCDPALMREVRPGTRIERVAMGSRLWADRMACVVPVARWRRRAADALAWRLESAWDVPDSAASWIRPAAQRALALHREQPFDAIYASGWPWSAFVLADRVAQRAGLPFLLDYRDLWTPTGTHEWEHETPRQVRASRPLERRIGQRATAVATVTDSLVGMIGKTLDRPVECITNGFEPADFDRVAKADPGRGNDSVRLAYTGVWRPGYGLDDLYRAVRLLGERGSAAFARLRVDAAGFAPGPARAHGVDDRVREHGPVSHDRALALMGAADAQILTVPSGYYAVASLPGKLFEYLGSGRPVLAIVPPGSEVARVLDNVGGAIRVDPGDVATLASTLEAIAEHRGAQFPPRRPERLHRYTRQATTEQLAGLLDRMVRNPVR
jgi:hypothetical protein